MSCYITYNNKNYTEKDFKEYLKSVLAEKQNTSTEIKTRTEEKEVAPTPPPAPKQATVFTPEMIRARVKSSFDANGYMDIKETSRGDKVILGAITKYIMATRGIVTNNQILEANKTFKLKEEVTIETIKEGVLRIKIKESLLEGDGDAGLFGGLNMSKLTSSGESMTNDIFKVKEGVSEVFKDNKSLASIGTEQQYSQYIDTIFPDSKVKDIVYHGTDTKFNKFNTVRPNGMFGSSFTTDFKTANQYTKRNGVGKDYTVLPVILNINKPKYVDYVEASFIKEKPTNYDAYIDATNDGLNHDEYIVFESEQIHILGSKQDVEGFKDFVNKNKSLNNIEQAFKCK